MTVINEIQKESLNPCDSEGEIVHLEFPDSKRNSEKKEKYFSLESPNFNR